MGNGGQTYDLVKIRELLNTAFDDAELDAFCLADYPKVYDKFSQSMRKDEKITLLLDYVRRRKRIPRLLTVISLAPGARPRIINLRPWTQPAPSGAAPARYETSATTWPTTKCA